MGLFTPKNPPNTIDDKRWGKIQRGANKAEARHGGMFTKRAAEQREQWSQQRSKRFWS